MSTPDKEEIERLFDEFQHTYVKSQELFDRLDGDPVRIQYQRIHDAEKGQKLRESIAKRDAARPKRTDAAIEAIGNEVLALQEKRPHLSWTRACEIVGNRQEPSLTSRRIRDLVPGSRWPK